MASILDIFSLASLVMANLVFMQWHEGTMVNRQYNTSLFCKYITYVETSCLDLLFCQ